MTTHSFGHSHLPVSHQPQWGGGGQCIWTDGSDSMCMKEANSQTLTKDSSWNKGLSCHKIPWPLQAGAVLESECLCLAALSRGTPEFTLPGVFSKLILSSSSSSYAVCLSEFGCIALCRSPQRPEEGTKALGAGVQTVVSGHAVLRPEPQSSALLTTKPFLHLLGVSSTPKASLEWQMDHSAFQRGSPSFSPAWHLLSHSSGLSSDLGNSARAICLCLLSTRIKDVHHRTQLTPLPSFSFPGICFVTQYP